MTIIHKSLAVALKNIPAHAVAIQVTRPETLKAWKIQVTFKH